MLEVSAVLWIELSFIRSSQDKIRKIFSEPPKVFATFTSSSIILHLITVIHIYMPLIGYIKFEFQKKYVTGLFIGKLTESG